jgi:integrase
MGAVYKKTFTKPLPKNAEIITRKGERLARWTDSKGRKRTAPVTTGTGGTLRIAIVARTYTAKFRDGSGFVREVATGCRDEVAARGVLGDLERRAELVKADVMTAAENAIADHQSATLEQHLDAFDVSLRAKDVTKEYRENCRRYLRRIAADCRVVRLADLQREAFESWLAHRSAEGMSARSRNAYRESLVSFCNWCVGTKRIIANPFLMVQRANEQADPRRKRRAMTEPELLRLLDVARRRPLLDAMTVRRGKRKGEAVAALRPDTVARLELLGRERALIYKTLLLTGLRLNELRSLTVGQLHLDGKLPFITLNAADEKNRQGSTLPIRSDLAADLKDWLNDRRERLYGAATIDSNGQSAGVIPMTGTPRSETPTDTPLFTVPKGLVRILDRDLKLAGIAKRDERGRTLDVHALRHTFGTLLSKGGVAPRTAQAAMRHSTIDLTMNTYVDPKLLDVQGALDALPALSLDAGPRRECLPAMATGTDDFHARPLAPPLAPTSGNLGQIRSIGGKSERPAAERTNPQRVAATPYSVNEKNPLTTAVNELEKSGRLDLNQRPLGPEPSALARLSHAPRLCSRRAF